jgi:RNA polymerase subunit RPABC4/transcription elongation factor Spt4
MPGYKHPCRYCSGLIDGDANYCPLCGKSWPFGGRCPSCRNKIEDGWKRCSGCGLEANCPRCGKSTFIVGECKNCGAALTTECKKCKNVEPLGMKECSKCGKPL